MIISSDRYPLSWMARVINPEIILLNIFQDLRRRQLNSLFLYSIPIYSYTTCTVVNLNLNSVPPAAKTNV